MLTKSSGLQALLLTETWKMSRIQTLLISCVISLQKSFTHYLSYYFLNMDIFLFIASQLLNSIWNLATSYGSKTKIENHELLITKRLEYMNLYVSHENEMESLQTIVQLLSTAALRQAVWHLKKYIPFKFYNIFCFISAIENIEALAL